MIDWNKIKIKIVDDCVYLDGTEFEELKIAKLFRRFGGTHDICFTILNMNVASVNEGKTVLLESLRNFLLNFGIEKDKYGENMHYCCFNIKWIAESGGAVGYINRHKIFKISQIAPLNYFYKAVGLLENVNISNLNECEKETIRILNNFANKVLG